MRFKMNPPLRTESDRQALIEGLRDGTIDCIATDHAPHASEEKEVPFEGAAMGVTGLETAFAAIHTDLVLPGTIELALLVERLAGGAAPFGLERPTLAPAARRTSRSATSRPSGRWARTATRAARSTPGAPAAGSPAGSLMTLAAGQVAFRLRSFSLGVAS